MNLGTNSSTRSIHYRSKYAYSASPRNIIDLVSQVRDTMGFRISVITPSYNSASFIEDAIISVLEQEYSNFEHVVIDAVSTDGTIDILKRYPHLKWVSETDSGQVEALHKGINRSTGDIIVCLNADDCFLPGAFNAVTQPFSQGAKFVVGKTVVQREFGDSFINDPKITHVEILRHWEFNAYPYNSVGYFYLREVFEAVGGFDSRSGERHDLDFLLAASRIFEFTKIDRTLGIYRDFENTITRRKQLNQDYWTFDNFKFIDKYLEDQPISFVSTFNKNRETGYAKMRRSQKWKQRQIERAKTETPGFSLSRSRPFRKIMALLDRVILWYRRN